MKRQSEIGRAAVAAILLSTAVARAVNSQERPDAAHAASTQVTAAATEAASATTGAGQTARDNRPGREGIKVHGYWVIDVRNADGSLAEHHEFENSLVTPGNNFLAEMLGGFLVPGGLVVEFNCGLSANGLCVLAPNTEEQNLLTTNGNCGSGSSNKYNICFSGLDETLNAAKNAIILKGNFQAVVGFSLTDVYTFLSYCSILSPQGQQVMIGAPGQAQNWNWSPYACYTAQAGVNPGGSLYGKYTLTALSLPFTSFSLTKSSNPAGPINVKAGQTIDFNVTLSFS
jgi:hypothetical protein